MFKMLLMWIPTWVIGAAFPAFFVAWFLKGWKYDTPRENRAAEAAAEREKHELAEHLANQKRADSLLESLVAAGAPCCLLSVRRTSSEPIEGGDQWMDPMQTLYTYQQFHEAMKLYGDD